MQKGKAQPRKEQAAETRQKLIDTARTPGRRGLIPEEPHQLAAETDVRARRAHQALENSGKHHGKNIVPCQASDTRGEGLGS